MKKSVIMRVISEVLKNLVIAIMIYGSFVIIIYEVAAMFTEPIIKVYCKDGKYGFRAKGLLSKETIFTSNEYLSIDTVSRVFIYEIDADIAGGREIVPVGKSIYVARDQFGKVDIFARMYRNKDAWGYRGSEETLCQLVHQCDSFAFTVDTALYCEPQLPPERSIKCPVNMIVYYKGNWKGLTSYRGGSTLPELEIDPMITYAEMVYAQP